ncbi:hypothetical protein [Allocoleopsis sp.]|uniref:hypothetical protein n=1 Tax=Allocoleopsis sp. TaxID=3088169 RepID=UPI002FD52CE5
MSSVEKRLEAFCQLTLGTQLALISFTGVCQFQHRQTSGLGLAISTFDQMAALPTTIN